MGYFNEKGFFLDCLWGHGVEGYDLYFKKKKIDMWFFSNDLEDFLFGCSRSHNGLLIW